MNLSEKLEQYNELKDGLATIKEIEMKLRLEIITELTNRRIGTADIVCGLSPGTYNFKNVEGKDIKMVLKENHNVDKTMVIGMEMTKDEEACLSWKPSLLITKHKATDTPNLDKAITVTPSVGTITVTETKTEKGEFTVEGFLAEQRAKNK